MTLRDYIIFVVVGAGLGGFVHNNTVAITVALRGFLTRFIGFTKHEAPILLADVEKLFQKHTDTILATVKQVPAVTIQHAQQAATAADAVAQIELAPADAVKRYIAGGLTTAIGMPNLYELRWLYAQPKPVQVAWGAAVAQAFGAQLAPATPPADLAPNATFTPNTETVGEIPLKMRVEAATYLFAVGGGFPNVGKTDWTLA